MSIDALTSAEISLPATPDATRVRERIAILARVGPDVLYAMFAVFVLTYATKELGMSRGEAVTAEGQAITKTDPRSDDLEMWLTSLGTSRGAVVGAPWPLRWTARYHAARRDVRDVPRFQGW